jgi:hypothetical protein
VLFWTISELTPARHDAHRGAVRAAALLLETLFADYLAGLVSNLVLMDSYLVLWVSYLSFRGFGAVARISRIYSHMYVV